MTNPGKPRPSAHVQRLLNGYANLTADERAQLKARIAEVDRGPEEKALNEAVEKSVRVTLGPTAPGCPCCGR